VFFGDTLLAIARLVGPPKSRGKPNLTVQRFPALPADPSLRDRVGTTIEKAKTVATFAVDGRKRRLARRDLDLILKTNSRPPAPAPRGKVDESLSALRDVLHYIETTFCNATTAYDSSPAPCDAETLLYA
jgi:hypothetical protein